LLTPNTLMR